MPVSEWVDAEAAIRVWANSRPGLTGLGNPLPNGVRLNAPRSSSDGATAVLTLVSPRRADDVTDDARASFRVSAVGRDGGGRLAAERAARALANELGRFAGSVVVVCPSGDRVKIVAAGDVQGPILSGDLGGEVAYSLDATFRLQPA